MILMPTTNPMRDAVVRAAGGRSDSSQSHAAGGFPVSGFHRRCEEQQVR